MPAPSLRRCLVRIWLVLVLVPLACLACASPPDPVPSTLVLRGETMGTYWVARIVVGGPSASRDDAEPVAAADRQELRDMIQAELDEVNRLMSNWLDDSETSRFNRHESTEPFPVSEATFEVVRRSLEIGRRTGGALDPTVEPLVRAYGFGGADPPEPPSAEELAEMRRHVGLDLLELDAEASTLRKLDPRVSIDLSSVAKGWAIDRVVDRLLDLGHGDVLVEVGGEVRVHGRNAEGDAWRLGIERPGLSLTPGQSVQRIVELRDGALATSGDYRNYREVEGRRISHIVDPRTGRPIDHRLASVSVVQPTCSAADGLATALMVLGPADGFERAVAEDIPALFLVRQGNGFVEQPTPSFEERFLRETAPSAGS